MLTYQPVIGLEIHAELLTRSKMFCSCPVVDLTEAPPNTAVCPVCAGLPGSLPVVNKRAVEFALRVALALESEIYPSSIFARKNYFYPDLPKGYQISQYEQPLARHGVLRYRTAAGEKTVRIRRVHLEEDTGKTIHAVEAVDAVDEGMPAASGRHSLIDLNRSGVPLLEIVTEPDLHTAEDVGAAARALRRLLQYLEVNSGDMEKGVLRIEPNISVRPAGTETLGTRTEVKNLNSFRALERAVAFEVERQSAVLDRGESVRQETVGWDEAAQATVPQRGKEEAHDYRYFPEPDLPPLLVSEDWIEEVRAALPELPPARFARYTTEFGLSEYDAQVLTAERPVSDYFDAVIAAGADPKPAANWITGELFALVKQAGDSFATTPLRPLSLAALLGLLANGTINAAAAQKVLVEMYQTGDAPGELVERLGLVQVSAPDEISGWVRDVLAANTDAVAEYASGKTAVIHFLFGQVMRMSGGRADPVVVREKLLAHLSNENQGSGAPE